MRYSKPTYPISSDQTQIMKIKADMSKALPKFFLVVLASGIFGGVAGASSLPEAVTAGVRHLLAAIVPWGIPVGSLVLLIWSVLLVTYTLECIRLDRRKCQTGT